MLKLPASKYLKLGELITDTRVHYAFVDSDLPSEEGPRQTKLVSYNLTQLFEMCRELGMLVSAELLSKYSRSSIPKSSTEFELIMTAINAEIQQRQFLFIRPSLAKYYE